MSAPMTAAAAPPAERPATKTRPGSTATSRHDLPGDPRDQRGLAAVALLIGGAEPVPAFLGIGRARLLGIGDEEALLFGQLVHPRAGGEILGRLGAAMQHHHQGKRLSAIGAGDVEPVGAPAGRIGIASLFEASAVRARRSPAGGDVHAPPPSRDGATMSMMPAVAWGSARSARGSLSDGAAAPPVRVRRIAAIASVSRPARVSRVASIMPVFRECLMVILSAVVVRALLGVSGCGPSAPPSPRGWLAGRRAPRWWRWSDAPARARHPRQ